MDGVLEVVVFEVGEAVGHVGFAGDDRSGPEGVASVFDSYGAVDVVEVGVEDEFWAEGAISELGWRQVEVILLFHHVIGEFVTDGETDTARVSIAVDHVAAGDFGLLTTVVRISGYVEGFPVRSDDRPGAFVEPLGRNADGTRFRSTAFDTPLEHSHAVCEILVVARSILVHGLAVGCAGHMRQSGAYHETPGGLVGMIETKAGNNDHSLAPL